MVSINSLEVQMLDVRKASPEGLKIQEWLTKGVFDAMEMQYLKRMDIIVADPIDELFDVLEEDSKLIERYSFDYDYAEDGSVRNSAEGGPPRAPFFAPTLRPSPWPSVSPAPPYPPATARSAHLDDDERQSPHQEVDAERRDNSHTWPWYNQQRARGTRGPGVYTLSI